MGGQGGKESLNDLGLVPQSVLMVKWEDEAMNSESLPSFESKDADTRQSLGIRHHYCPS